jgi:hypothetical protein
LVLDIKLFKDYYLMAMKFKKIIFGLVFFTVLACGYSAEAGTHSIFSARETSVELSAVEREKRERLAPSQRKNSQEEKEELQLTHFSTTNLSASILITSSSPPRASPKV